MINAMCDLHTVPKHIPLEKIKAHTRISLNILFQKKSLSARRFQIVKEGKYRKNQIYGKKDQLHCISIYERHGS